MQYCSLPVGHRKRCDESNFHKMCIETDKLLVKWEKSNETGFHKVWNVTHKLFVGHDEKRGDNSAGTLRESSSHLSMIVLKTQLSGCKRKRSYCPIYDTGQAYIPIVCKYM